MSTHFTAYKEGHEEIVIVESSAKFDLDLYGYSSDEHDDVYGGQNMSAKKALDLAAGIIHAVWCSYPDEAEMLIQGMNEDIPSVWNQIVKERR